MKFAIFCLTTALCTTFALLLTSCAASEAPSTPSPEPPPTRGQRDRVMSELHGARKLLSDALESVSAERLATPGAGETASPAEAVEALMHLELTIQSAMQNSSPGTVPHPTEAEGLSREEQQKLNEESDAAMQAAITSCLEQYPIGEFRPPAGMVVRTGEELASAFRTARDGTIQYARETEHNFLRRKIELSQCGSMDLRTAMMLQAELTAKVAEVVKAAGN